MTTDPSRQMSVILSHSAYLIQMRARGTAEVLDHLGQYFRKQRGTATHDQVEKRGRTVTPGPVKSSRGRSSVSTYPFGPNTSGSGAATLVNSHGQIRRLRSQSSVAVKQREDES